MEGIEIKRKKNKKKLKEKVKKLINTEAKNLWGSFKDEILEACEKFCRKRKRRREQESIWWLNEKVQEAMKSKKNACKKMCKIRSEEDKNNYKKERDQTKNCQ